jgi:branched-chain amino acid transport system permease protein
MAAAANSIDTMKYEIVAFSVGAFFTGLCGGLSAYYMFHIHPAGALLSFNPVLMPILMTILSGTMTFWGPVPGGFTTAPVFELASAWMPEFHAVFSSAFGVLVTLFLPGGMVVWITGH